MNTDGTLYIIAQGTSHDGDGLDSSDKHTCQYLMQKGHFVSRNSLEMVMIFVMKTRSLE